MSFTVGVDEPPCVTCGRSVDGWQWSGMTYNCSPMFRQAGFYDAIKAPLDARMEDKVVPATMVKDVVDLVRAGLKDMIDNADDYRKLNPSNGWGDYEGALKFTKELLDACERFPDGIVDFRG